MKRNVTAFVLLLLSAGTAFAAEPKVDPKSQFPAFCEEWMGKLAAREKRNVSLIKWDENGSNVSGSYIGYSNQHSCIFKESDGPVPVGKITYLEVLYEKRGTTREEAERNPAQAVETTEVTEIFRYAKGQWVY